MIGQLVGNYRIIQLLGEGGMGAVYLAEHPGIGRKAAVKVLHPAYAAEQEFVGRFFNEARAANATRHPGIVEIFDFGTLPSGASYIIMELLEGESLAAYIKRAAGNPSDIDMATEIIWQAAGALGAAHGKGIVHRDLKPDNMYLVPDLQNPGRFIVKLLDFGIAKLGGAGQLGSGSMRTRTGAVMGTPVYMSPEQCRGTKEVDHRTDLYALGIILYELVCGTPPFVSEGFGEMTFLHISAAPTPPRATNPRIPERLERIILKMLAKDPGDRLQSATDVQQALRPTTGRPGVSVDMRPATATRSMDTGPRQRTASGGVQAGGTHVLPTGPHGPLTTTFSDATGSLQDAETLTITRRRRWLIPVALVGAAAIGGVVIKTRVLAPQEDAEQEAAQEPAPPRAASAATAPATAPAPRTVPVAIESTPSGARLVRLRDGAILGSTPFKESWPAGDGTEKLRIEKDGYRPEGLVVPMDHGLTFTVELIAAAPPTAPPAATPPPATGPRAKPGRHHHGPTGGPAAPAPAAGASPAATPSPPPKPATPDEPVAL